MITIELKGQVKTGDDKAAAGRLFVVAGDCGDETSRHQ